MRLEDKAGVLFLDLLYEVVVILVVLVDFGCVMRVRERVISVVSESSLELLEPLDPEVARGRVALTVNI